MVQHFISYTYHGVEDFEERETIEQFLDCRDHSYQQDQEKEDIAEHEDQIVHSHTAYVCMGPTSGDIQAGSAIMHDLLCVVYGGNQYIDAEWIGRARDVARVGTISVVHKTRAKKS